jgi:hypothetical protein
MTFLEGDYLCKTLFMSLCMTHLNGNGLPILELLVFKEKIKNFVTKLQQPFVESPRFQFSECNGW